MLGSLLDLISGRDPSEGVANQYNRNAATLGEYRPQQANARMQAMQHAMQAFKPQNDMLQQMYGPAAGQDLNALANPMSNVPVGSMPDSMTTAFQHPDGSVTNQVSYVDRLTGGAGGLGGLGALDRENEIQAVLQKLPPGNFRDRFEQRLRQGG